MKKKLLAYGFVETSDCETGEFLKLDITGTHDRFKTRLRWYEDSPEQIYIDRYLMRGLETVSENEVLSNHNGLHNGAELNWKKFKDTFPKIEAV